MAKITQADRDLAITQYSTLITTTLENQIKINFPDSKIEYLGNGEWNINHQRENGEKCIDLEVKLEDNGRRVIGFHCARSMQGRGFMTTTIELTKEALDDAIRKCIYSR